MTRKVSVLLFILLSTCLITFGYAGPVPARIRHADKNKDGVVDSKEIKMEKSEVNTPWENKADVDNDGRVEKAEAAAWRELKRERADLNNDGVLDSSEKRLFWKYGERKVDNPIEAKYDLNGDGWLSPAESRELLKDKRTLIKTDGKAKVDTAIEAEYDTNADGILDASEAKYMNDDLG